MKMQMLAGIALASVLALSAVPATHADEFDQATQVSFSSPVRVPGNVLPAGTYWFVIASHGHNPDVVQVFNADRTRLIRTILTGSAERPQATGKTVLAFANPDTSANPGEVPALTKWFYPGRVIGTQFFYSNQTERRFRHETEVVVPSGPNGTVVVGD